MEFTYILFVCSPPPPKKKKKKKKKKVLVQSKLHPVGLSDSAFY